MSDLSFEEILKPFSSRLELPILWGYMDAWQHVNNAVYFRLFESGRVQYFDQIETGLNKPDHLGMILHSTNCRFRIPLTYPDTVTVGSRTVEIGEDRIIMQQVIVSHQYQKVAAEGRSTIVAYDYEQLQKALLVPQFKEKVIALDNPATYQWSPKSGSR